MSFSVVGGRCGEWFTDDSSSLPLLCTLFYYYYINSTLGHQALGPRGWGLLNLKMWALVTCFLATSEFFWHWGVAFFLFSHLWWVRATFSQETGIVILLTGWNLWINLKNWNSSAYFIKNNEKIELIRIFWKWGWRQVFVCCFLVWIPQYRGEIPWLRVVVPKLGWWTEPLEKIGFPWPYLYPWVRTLRGWWSAFRCRNMYF